MQTLSLSGSGGGASRFAVIDTETTGLTRYDRIVEFACVTVMDGEIVEEYETLLQPDRDPGPTHIHGITASMLEAAPEFKSVAGDIASRLNGASLVAHNISFDVRMLRQEIGRVPTMTFDAGTGVCTYRLTRQKLSVAASEEGISASAPYHTALNDARVAAQLLLRMQARGRALDPSPASCHAPDLSTSLTVRRPGAPPRRGALSMLALRTAWPQTETEGEVLYLDTLDRCLDDGELSREEKAWLDSTAAALRLSATRRADLHRRYYTQLVDQILADEVVTETEQTLHDQVADALMIDVRDRTVQKSHSSSSRAVHLVAGMTVCFTGVVMEGGELIPRSALEDLARKAGLQPVRSVTKKCDLVVSGDVRSRSRKASRARDLKIPLIDAAEFKALVAKDGA